jgi:hypothetical protein
LERIFEPSVISSIMATVGAWLFIFVLVVADAAEAIGQHGRQDLAAASAKTNKREGRGDRTIQTFLVFIRRFQF